MNQSPRIPIIVVLTRIKIVPTYLGSSQESQVMTYVNLSSPPNIIVYIIQRKLFLIFVKLSLNGKDLLCFPGPASRTRTYARRSYPSCFGALVAIIIAKGKLQPNVPSDTPISIISKDKLYTEPNNPSLLFNAEGVAIFDLLNFLRIHGCCSISSWSRTSLSLVFRGGVHTPIDVGRSFHNFISLGGGVSPCILSLCSRFWYFSDKHRVKDEASPFGPYS